MGHRILSYNVNGIRAAIRKGFAEWLVGEDYDTVCLQEIKATPDQFNEHLFTRAGYTCYWNPAEKKGYSGTAVLCKSVPEKVVFGLGAPEIDKEGRSIQITYPDLTIINLYLPSGSSGDKRQNIKMQWLDHIYRYITEKNLNFRKTVICGDFNICHQPVDIHDPARNKNSPGFLPEERNWLDQILELGFVDTFRYFNDKANQYTWWSYRSGARSRNKGWRIDYQLASAVLKNELTSSNILSDIVHSDHCPIELTLH